MGKKKVRTSARAEMHYADMESEYKQSQARKYEVKLTSGQEGALRALLKAVEVFVELEDRNFTLAKLSTLLAIALNQGETQATIAKVPNIGLSPPLVSKHVGYWSTRDRHMKDGKNFVLQERNPLNKSEYATWLTPDGRAFLEDLLVALK